MHINLLCSLNQYCSLKDMTSGQLCLNIDSIVICIRYQTKYMIHQHRPFSFQRVFDFVSSYEMRQKKDGDIPECTHEMGDLSIAEQSHYGEIMSRPFISKRMENRSATL